MTNGNATTQTANTMAEAAKQQLEINGEDIRFKMTDEARALMNSKQTFDTVEVTQQGKAFARSITVEQALQQLINPANKPSSTDIISDQIEWIDLNKQRRTVPCAVSKVLNCVTDQVKEAVFFKVYSGCQTTHNKSGIETKAEIKRGTSLSLYTAKVTPNTDLNHITKRASAGDVSLSATWMPDNIQNEAEIDKFLQWQQSIKEVLLYQTLTEIKNSNGAVISAYRNINRSAIEDIFEAAYVGVYGMVDVSDKSRFAHFLKMRREFFATLSNAFLTPTAEFTIDLGISIRKMVVSEEQQWSSKNKIGHVHQNAVGSFYVTSDIDIGLNKIPITLSVFESNTAMIDAVTRLSMQIVEKEARSQLGLEGPEPDYALYDQVEVPEVPTREYYKILGITETQQAEIIDNILTTARDIANAKVKAVKEDEDVAHRTRISDIMRGGE